MLRVGVIGVGHLGKNHARLYHEMASSELVGVVDTNPDQGKEIARLYGTEYFERGEDLVPRVDAVSVVVPTPQHLSASRPFLEAGKAVLVEKPLASTPEQADEIIALAEASGSTLQVGHIERFNPVIMSAFPYLKDALFIECDRIHPFSLRSTDVSVVLDLMIHDIDLVLHIVDGEVEDIDAVGAEVLSTTDDMAIGRIVFENGCAAMVKTSRVAYQRSRKMRVFCPRSYVSLDLVARSGFRIFMPEDYDPRDFTDETGRLVAPEGEAAFLAKHMSTEPIQISVHEPLRAELECFLRAVEERTPPLVTGHQGRRAMAVAERIQERIAYHKSRVKVSHGIR